MKRLAMVILVSLFFSCTNDSQENLNTDVVITGYKIQHFTSPEFTFVTIGNTLNNKLFSETEETFINGVSQGQTTEQKYFYNDDGLLDHRILNEKITYFY